jgi:acetyl-CoA acetyltransferase
MGAAYIYGVVRTPFGRYGGALAKVRPDDLAASALRALLDRAPELDPGVVDDVILGDANGAGEDNRDVARMAVLLAGLPTTVPGATVNRLCGSSLEAAIQAARAIETGDAEVMVAGGVESMSRAPWVMPKPARPPGRPRDALVDDARLADGQPEDAGAVDDQPRRIGGEARRRV